MHSSFAPYNMKPLKDEAAPRTEKDREIDLIERLGALADGEPTRDLALSLTGRSKEHFNTLFQIRALLREVRDHLAGDNGLDPQTL